MKYFSKDANGLNADIDRHSAEEAKLNAKIAELQDKDDPKSKFRLSVYRSFLNKLLQSKSEVVNKIGKKNS